MSLVKVVKESYRGNSWWTLEFLKEHRPPMRFQSEFDCLQFIREWGHEVKEEANAR